MQQITASELRDWMGSGRDFMLIDIREDWEHQASNIGGRLIPMGEIMAHLPEIPKDKEVVLYCEKGIRSVITIQRLESLGYHNLINLSGGMKAWRQSQEE